MLLLFAITLFVSAALMFLVQPMFAKMVLPLLGGTPAVWNTCMVFFQATLLAGYGYVHVTTAWFGVRRQAAIHLGLLLLPLLALPIGIRQDWAPPVQQNPIPWLLVLLLVSVGLPFFVISATAPMLQKWFANTGHPSGIDPYFLYGASNLGSMLALLSYPVLMEPNLLLSEQTWMWAGGYGMLVVLTLGCAVALWRSPVTNKAQLGTRGTNPCVSTKQNPIPGILGDGQGKSSIADRLGVPTLGQRTYWVVLSLIPSSLMLAVTTYLTTDLPPIPLLWVIPLAIYLLTFMLVFARRPILPHRLMVRMLPFGVLLLSILIPIGIVEPLYLLIPLHLLTFFFLAMICHGELVQTRPPSDYLTEFYLWMSVGGVLGGLFNALIAPLIFKSVLEYPLVMVLACLIQSRNSPREQNRFDRWLDFALPLALGGLLAGLARGAQSIGMRFDVLLLGLMTVPTLICFAFRNRPIRFGLGVGAIMLAIVFSIGGHGRVLYAARSFFGVYRIVDDAEGKNRFLISGFIAHGAQSLELSRRREPLLYFYRTGPIGQVFAAFSETRAKSKVAIVGLGIGSMACYGEPGQQFTFYEIDPAVERIARDPRYFTFLQDCLPKKNVILGDARISLKKAPDHYYGLIALDAFSSDTIPLHLLTREAIRLYLAKLADDGILVFHISNRKLDLRPVLSDLARDARLAYLVQSDANISDEEQRNGKLASWWAVMARKHDHLSTLAEDSRWKVLPGRPGARVWTDDFSNILGVIRWTWE